MIESSLPYIQFLFFDIDDELKDDTKLNVKLDTGNTMLLSL